MAILSEQASEQVKARFDASLDKPVTIRLFTESEARSLLSIPGRPPSQHNTITRSLMEEVSSLSDKLHLEIFDVHGLTEEEAGKLGIRRIPAIILGDDEAGRIRFYGAPIGNEFPTLLEGIDSISSGTPQLPSHIIEAAEKYIHEPVHIQVFVTPT